jgi:pyrophosphatase PpaX
MRFQTVLFDLDGTLIDSGSLILSSFRHATRSVLGRTIADEVLMENVGGHGLRAQMLEFDAERVDELVRVYREHNHEAYRAVQTFEGIDALLDRMSAAGQRLGVVTVKGRVTVELTFELLPIGHYFETVVTGDDTERHKPDPEPLRLALGNMGADPETAAYVGDSPFDIQAAQGAGMTSIAVSWGKIHPLVRLEAERPDHVVHTPGELLDVV